MSDIENIKKSLDDVEKALITKAIANDGAKKELRENIAKQLDTLILKAEVELLQKHITADMFTKPVTEPAKAIAKPAIDVGKKIGSAVGKVGAKIGAGASKVGRGIADYGKGVGTAAKVGASTWKDPTPKPVAPVITKPTKTATPKISNINVTTASKVPAAVGAKSQPKKKAAPIKSTTPPRPSSPNLSVEGTMGLLRGKEVPSEKPTGIKSDFGGTTSATKTSGGVTSGASKLLEQADKLERQLTQPKPKKVISKPAAQPKPEPVVEAPKFTAYQQAQKDIQNKLAAKKSEAATSTPVKTQTTPVVPFKSIPKTPKVNLPTGKFEPSGKVRTIKAGKEPDITTGTGDETGKQMKRSSGGI